MILGIIYYHLFYHREGGDIHGNIIESVIVDIHFGWGQLIARLNLIDSLGEEGVDRHKLAIIL